MSLRALLVPIILVTALMILGGTAASASGKLSDDDVRQLIPGSWIVPLDSPDRTNTNDRAFEVFRPDGTYTDYLFSDDACTKLSRQITLYWWVKDRVLFSAIGTNGAVSRIVSRDDVISIENGKMTLHSLEDDSTYTRVKSTTCEPGSKT
jgi:hypothetical protein